LTLLAMQPASQNGEHHLKSGRVNHLSSLCHQARSLLHSIGRALGHYASRVRRHPRLGGLLNFCERAA
jgi:hypothetical protein